MTENVEVGRKNWGQVSLTILNRTKGLVKLVRRHGSHVYKLHLRSSVLRGRWISWRWTLHAFARNADWPNCGSRGFQVSTTIPRAWWALIEARSMLYPVWAFPVWFIGPPNSLLQLAINIRYYKAARALAPAVTEQDFMPNRSIDRRADLQQSVKWMNDLVGVTGQGRAPLSQIFRAN